MKAANVIAVLVLALSLTAQQTAPSIDVIIRRATEQRLRYVDTFKNLLTQETKTIEVFDRRGRTKKKRVIKSNFIVYPLTRNNDRATEYRSVYSVDGKAVSDEESRAQEFFDKIARVESSAKELERIRAESLRFDDDILISNMTLFQSVVLSDDLRSSFALKLVGKETIDGRSTYRLEYQQTHPSPRIAIGTKESSGSSVLAYDIDLDGLEDVNGRLSGRFWIDAETFNLVREHRLLTIQPTGYESPVTISENWFEYGWSEFDVFTPRKITHLQFDVDKKKRTSVKGAQVTFEYGAFTRPDVDVKASEVKQP